MQKNQALIIPAFLWVLGIIIAKQTVLPVPVLLIVIPVLLLLSLINNFRFISLCFAIVLLAILRFDIQSEFPENHIKTLLERNTNITRPITGRIISEVKIKDGNNNFTLELHQINKSVVYGKIKFYTRTDSLNYGDIISVVAVIKKFLVLQILPLLIIRNFLMQKEYLALVGLYHLFIRLEARLIL